MSESDTEFVERMKRGWRSYWEPEDVNRLLSLARKGAEANALSARVKDLTLEGLAHIGRLEAVREVLAGTDIGSLPKDYPTLQMAQDRMAELAALREELSIWKSVFPDIAPERVLPDRSKIEAEAAALRTEVERLNGIEELYKAGCAAWNPVFKVVLDERDALRARVEKLEGALSGVLWMAEEWFKHGGDETTFADEYEAKLVAARAALTAPKDRHD